MEFFNKEGNYLGDKYTLATVIREITVIPTAALKGQALSSYSLETRMSWTRTRRTTRKEDEAYCLLGIFDVYMPLIYGEGVRAKHRLRDEIYYHEKRLRLEAERTARSEGARRPARPRPNTPDHRVAPRMALDERFREQGPEDTRQSQGSRPDRYKSASWAGRVRGYDRTGLETQDVSAKTLTNDNPEVFDHSEEDPASWKAQFTREEDIKTDDVATLLHTLKIAQPGQIADSDLSSCWITGGKMYHPTANLQANEL